MAATRKCNVCGRNRSLAVYPTSTAITCLDCLHAKPEERLDDELPAPGHHESPVEAADEAPFRPVPDLEIDPSNPTHRELAARFAANRSLLQFIRRFRPKYMAAWVHEDLCRRLEQFVASVERLEEPRLLVCFPVRHGKSEIASRHLPAWVLGHHPDWEIIATSGALSLALSFSRYVRDLMRDASFSAVFPGSELDPQGQSIENWSTTVGGGYLAAGVGTMITGRGAHILLIDDPVKDAEAADSQLIRDNTWEWYISTALTRLAPGGGVLIIMTWWNEDDLAGRVQQLNDVEGADTFEVVKYPAINDEGDEYILPDNSIQQFPQGSTPPPEGSRLTRVIGTALHGARYTLKSLLQRKATYAALGQQRWWSALYQQDPTPAGGAFFTKEMLVEFTHAPKAANRIVLQAWDFAITENQKSDWTVGMTAILDEYDTLFIIDVWRFKTDDGIELGTAICKYAQNYRVTKLAVEDGQIWKSIRANFEKACEAVKFYPSFEAITPFTDKRTRAQPARGRMQQNKVQFNGRAAWWPALKQELLRFQGGGKHDDQVDALAHLVRLATSMPAPTMPQPAKMKSWRDKLPGSMRGRLTSHMAE
jgi:predicted phage terminase large subunit-like protein